MGHALKKWQGYNYENHILMVIALVLQKVYGYCTVRPPIKTD